MINVEVYEFNDFTQNIKNHLSQKTARNDFWNALKGLKPAA